MISSSMIGLINNAALLLAMGLLYELMGPKTHHETSKVQGVVSGLVLGLIGIAIMLNPWEFSPGVVFDTRSVLLGITGLFFGTIPVAIAVFITGAFRLAMGGTGAWTGVAVIVASGGIGLIWRRLSNKNKAEIKAGELYLLGVVVHGVMLLCMLTLPWPLAKSVLSHISLPVMLVCPVATAALGLLLVSRSKSKLAHELLANSEALYRNLFMNHAAVKLVIDPDTGDIVEANRAAEEFYGWSIAELERMRIQDINTLSHGEVKAEMERARSLNRIYFQFRHRRADGSVRDVGVFSSRIEMKGKEMLHSIVHDVTERREAEEARRRSEEFQRAMIATSPVALYSIDPHGNVITWNESAERIFGWKAEEVIGSPLPFVPDEKQNEFDDLRKRVLSGETFSKLEILRQRKTGELFDCSLSTAPIHDDHGKVIGIMGALEDITYRKQVENNLIESEKRYRALFENMTAGFVLFEVVQDDEGNPADLTIIAANKGFEITAGLMASEVTGKLLTKVLPGIENDAADWIENYGMIALNGNSRQFEQRSELLGHYYFINAYQSGPKQCAVTFTDITDRKKAEAERKKLKEQLAQAQKMEAVGRLAGGIAHDLNNLLSPILGYGEMLAKDISEKDSNKESAEEIVSAGYRARDLIRQLLAFSRNQPLEFMFLNMNKIIQDFKKLLQRTVRENIQIQLELTDDLPAVKGDAGQIEQIIMNLVVNAQDAMPDGGKLKIENMVVDLDEAYPEESQEFAPGRYVMLAVSDTGRGMDKEKLERVFEPFYTTKKKGKGTGLGLSTVYGIVKQHGGNVWVYSEPGQGTTFKCYFPALNTEEAHLHKSSEKQTEDLRGDETIVVAEDSEAVRKLAVSILMRQGYNVYWASNGEQCIRICRENGKSIQLLVADVVLPDMNGRQLYNQVFKINPDLKVLYASGYTDNVIAHYGILGKEIHFIQKPFSIQGFAGKVRSVLDGQ